MSLDNIEIRKTYLLDQWVIAKMSKKNPNMCNQKKEIDISVLKEITTNILIREFELGNKEMSIKTEKGLIIVKMELQKG